VDCFPEEGSKLADRHPSAIKRNRQNIKRQERNYAIRSRLRNEIRKFREVAAGDDSAATETALRSAISQINKASTKGVLHKNAAARRVARLTKAAKAQA
jgi:small subunit ribosomal protein S20